MTLSTLAVTADSGAPRLWAPSPKVAMRLERQAIERVAAESRDSFDRVEDIYGRSRSSIAHLRHHADEPTRFPNIRAKVKELVDITDKFLAAAQKEHYGTARWRADLARATQKLKSGTEAARVDTLIVPAEIEMFLKVVDAARELYEKEGCDFSGFIDQQIYVLAGMVVANFPAYQKTLNE